MHHDHQLKDPKHEYRLYFGRVLMAAAVVLLLVFGLLWRYYHLQVDRYQDFQALSDSNRVHVQPVPPTRGLIYDRNGVLLADNRPSFTLRVVKEHVDDLDQLLTELGTMLAISEEESERFKKLLSRRRPYEAVPLRYNLTEQEQGVLAVNAHRLPGVEVAAQLVRHYPLGEALAHVTGYVSRISERELTNFSEQDQRDYSGTYVIGKRGLEYFYERELLGAVGSENVETNSRGRVMRVLERDDPQPGSNLTLFLDSELQKVALEALDGERGSVIALDTRTGGVLAMASGPTYDANLFVTGISHKDYNALVKSPDRPLLNRSLQGTYPPASTLKPTYGLAILETGVARASTTIFDPGFYQLPNDDRKYRDWKKGGHGSKVDLHMAIERSCDTYYYKMSYEMGIDRMAPYGTMFGLGQPSGIDLSGEKSGIMPTREWKRGYKGLPWYPGDTLNSSLGQGFTLATPMQLALMTVRLANRGWSRPPRLVQAVNGVPVELEPPLLHVEASDRNWQTVHKAMEAVVHSRRGTAKGINKDLSYRIAGKTGTAQVIGIAQDEEYDAEAIAKRKRDHALFIAYAPADDPQIAVAVIVENGEHGSTTAAPIARKVMDAWLLKPTDTVAAAGGH